MAKRRYTKKEIEKLHALFAQWLSVAECARQLGMPESTVRDHRERWMKRPEVATLVHSELHDVLSYMRRIQKILWIRLLQSASRGDLSDKVSLQALRMIDHVLQQSEPFSFAHWLSEMIPLEILPREHKLRLLDGEPYHLVAFDAIREGYKHVNALREQGLVAETGR